MGWGLNDGKENDQQSYKSIQNVPGVENGGPALIGQAFGGFGGPGRWPIINENQANGHKERETGPNSPWARGLAILLIYLYHI